MMYRIDVGDLRVVDLDMVNMRVVDMGVIVAVSYTHLTLPTIYSV